MKRRATAAVLALALFMGGCAKPPTAAPLPEAVEMLYFYDNSCGSCNDAEKSYTLFNDKLGEDIEKYPFEVQAYNIFETVGKQRLVQVLAEYGHDPEMYKSFPILVVYGRIYAGEESIERNIREAYLTAGEDIFENRYLYLPTHDEADALPKRFSVDVKSSTIVYFYRITCDECIQTADVINTLPDAVDVEGEISQISVIRLNTRSGNNGAHVIDFFDRYAVPPEEQMVPIVFFADTYLAGYEAISQQLVAMLKEGHGLEFSFG